MALQTLKESSNDNVTLSKEEFHAMAAFIAEVFTDMFGVSFILKSIDDRLHVSDCYDKVEEKLKYGKSTALLMKLTDKHEIKRLKEKGMALAEVVAKYKKLYDQINKNL